MVKPDYIGIIEEIVRSYGQPYSDSSALPTYYVCSEAGKNVKVALNGDAGDENFAGYGRYSFFEKNYGMMERFRLPLNMINKLGGGGFPGRGAFSGRMRKLLSMLDKPPSEFYLITQRIIDEETKREIYSKEMLEEFGEYDPGILLGGHFGAAGIIDNADRMLYSDLLTYLPGDLTVKTDIASMANSLESRSPFLDHRVVEFAASLPSKWKMKGKKKKIILKDTFSDILPNDILRREKMGFGIPIDSWFREEWKEFFYDTVLSEKALSRGYFNRKGLEQIFNEHIGGRRDHGYRMWNLLVLELWQRMFIDR